MNWFRGRRKLPLADLSALPKATLALLIDSTWRSRVVEQIEIDRATSCRNTRSVRLAPLAEYLDEFMPEQGAESIKVALPLATLPKRPLINFDLRGGTGDVLLLKRREIAERQAFYVSTLASSAGVPAPKDVLAYLTAICEFTPGRWQRYDEEFGKKDPAVAVSAYLNDGLELVVPQAKFGRWCELASEIATALSLALDEGYDPLSSADNPLVALPLLFGRANPPTATKIDSFICSLHEFVKLCAEADGPQAGSLEALGDYGRRYEALVYCTVPADEPHTLQMSQQLPLHISRLHRTEIEVVFNDATSNHFSVRMLDPDVEIKRLPRSVHYRY